MNAICLVVDRLHVGYLGAYGNSWIETPSLDRLASEAFLFDWAMIDSPSLESLYQSLWYGWHVGGPVLPNDRPTITGRLAEAGVRTTLLTDEPLVARLPQATEFDELIELTKPNRVGLANEVSDTHLADCFSRLVEEVSDAERPFFMWSHLSGMDAMWDAPYEFRARYSEEDDPEPTDSSAVPNFRLPENYDPDELLAVTQAYAGQVTLLDTCFGAFMEFLRDEHILDDTLLLVCSSRGFPLGEHGRVGPCDDAVYGELVHVPLMVRFPDGLGAAARSQAMVEPADVRSTLLDWWQLNDDWSPTGKSLMPVVRADVESVRDRLRIVGPSGDNAICSPAWYLRTAEESELFVRPDDRWEVSNVASRCRDIVEQLEQVASQYDECLRSAELDNLEPLNDVLVSGLG